ncbi:MAG: hypothetical protein JSV56_04360 [Methanomassiliicoccales archaeon]|nr:MAG: hypothetical protein JSV56_04360 [Methanomassiliicoccales archaeon]
MIAVIGIVLLMASFVLPWWGRHVEMEQTMLMGDERYYHSEAGFGVSISSGISYSGSGTGFYIGGSTSTVYFAAAILIILALICASLMVTALIISLINNNIKPKLPLQLGVLALVFCLLAPIIFMIALPGAMKADEEKKAEDSGEDYKEPDRNDPTKSFFGNYEEKENNSHSISTTKSNWGGDIGWVLSLVSFSFFVISVVMMRPRKAPLPSPELSPEQTNIPEPQPQVQYELPPPPPPV